MKSLLLDVGSSFIKYSFYDSVKGELFDICSVPFPSPCVCDGVKFEVAVGDIKEAVMRIFDEGAEYGCSAAFISVQMHGYVLKKDGAFSNYVSWQDKRGADAVKVLSHLDLTECGTAVKANLPLVSLYGKSNAEGAEFFTLGSYLAFALTGKNVTHVSDGCASGFFKKSGDAAHIEGFEGLILPTVTSRIISIGEYRNISVYTPLGDHQISFLGSGIADDELLLNVGTAVNISCLQKKGLPKTRGVEYRPYFSDDDLVTVTGIKSKDANLAERIKDALSLFSSKKRIIIGGGGAVGAYAELECEIHKMGFSVALMEKNVGMSGLVRIARSIYPIRGTMLSEIGFVNFPAVLKKAGLDFFIIDNEHGSFDTSYITALAQRARHYGIRAIVRLPDNQRSLITKLADGGVSAFLLPMTNCREDIERVVEYAKYSPIGKRGISTTRAHTDYGVDDLSEYMKQANERMEIYAQIETLKGIENLSEILGTEGVSGVFIGPNDLSCDLDCIGDTDRILPYISRICNTCFKLGKRCGIITANKKLIKHALLSGADSVSCGSEINMIIKGAKEIADYEYF